MAVLLSAIIFGGGIYAYQNWKAKQDRQVYKNQIDAADAEKAKLVKQVADLSETVASGSQAKTPVAKSTTYTSTFGNFSFDVPDGYAITSNGKLCEGACAISLKIVRKINDLSYIDTYVSVDFFEETNYNMTFNDLINKNKISESINKGILEDQGVVKIGGVNANKYYCIDCMIPYTEWLFVNGNFGFKIKAEGIDLAELYGIEKNAQDTLTDKIITTFKFTK